ncbi:alternate signal-mediated exported protein, RER_14450 family [Arthrobacter alpinus]|uniref:Alternate signal-mediated exported protein, RER_14450 family n=1 Tax=Arthrobacter alpinus TaxID=656366 RepID=A0A1H5KG13_9MICC|nr:alternate-type signal peptide domain-containing protein [Arthrobacter alpinus]SEE63786.1 alternate signal-mediated exported protein, RER_14450 family [Arthrobacter alpinus]
MNKMAKGAIATGVGIILLAGGGGTLATWNQTAEGTQGKVVAGDLNMVAGTGVWKNAKNQTVTISSYKVVPGDVLTYTQPLTVTLEGDLMVAKLSLKGTSANNGFVPADFTAVTTLTDAAGVAVSANTPLNKDHDGAFTATTKFTFAVGTAARSSVNGEYNFADIGYKLEQQVPDATLVP